METSFFPLYCTGDKCVDVKTEKIAQAVLTKHTQSVIVATGLVGHTETFRGQQISTDLNVI